MCSARQGAALGRALAHHTRLTHVSEDKPSKWSHDNAVTDVLLICVVTFRTPHGEIVFKLKNEHVTF